MKRILILIMMIFSIGKAYTVLDGSQWVYTGFSPSLTGDGYVGASSYSYAGDLFVNPANPAFSQRFRLFAQWGFTEDHYLGDLGFSYSHPAGVIWGGFQTLYLAPPETLNSVMGIKLGFSKLIQDNFAFGFDVFFINQANTNAGDFGVGVDLGGVLLLGEYQTSEKGLVFSENRVGFAMTGLGKPAYADADTPLPGLGLRAGYSSLVMNYEYLQLRLGLDLGMHFIPWNIFANFSAKITLGKHFNFSAGYMFGNNGIGNYSKGIWPFTLGLSIDYQFGDTPVEIFYSFNPYKFDTENKAVHFVGMEVAFGSLDTNPPECNIELPENSEHAYFSPNYDGKKDTIDIEINIEDSSLIMEWKVVIMKSNGIKIKEFSGREVRVVVSNSMTFWGRLWQSKEGIPVPETVKWDGITDFGTMAKDATYLVYLTATDEMDNIGSSKTNLITLDTSPPYANISLSEELFSPNNDGRKDTITIEQKLSPDAWTAEIISMNKVVIREWKWTNDSPTNLVWDGSDGHGEIAEDGSYDYVLYGWDRAGNKTTIKVEGINLTTEEQSIFISPENSGFSPNDDGEYDILKVFFTFSDTDSLELWTFTVRDFSSNVVMSETSHEIREFLTWDGLDVYGDSVPDGEYYCKLSAVYESGNTPSSQEHMVIVDTTPPNIEFGYTPELFSPDDDGENDVMLIELTASDTSDISKWKLIVNTETGRPFKTFEGSSTPSDEFEWDGHGDDGELVESASDYYFTLYIEDTLGNELTNMSLGEFQVDVLVEDTEQGYKIRINNIEFAEGETILKGISYPVLDRVAEILKKYPGYKVKIQGHTDPGGDEEENLELSYERAEAVKNYLIYKEVKSSRMTAEGLGSLYPVENEDTEEAKRKNRRVEFILMRE